MKNGKPSATAVAITISVVIALCVIGGLYAHDAKFGKYSMQHPTKTSYHDLEYSTNGGETQLLCTELAAEGKCVLETGNIYDIHFNIPEALHDEALQGGNWRVDISYTAQVDTDDPSPTIWVKIFNADTGHLYVAQSGFNVDAPAEIHHKLALFPNGTFGLNVKDESVDSFAKLEALDFKLEVVPASSTIILSDSTGKSCYAWRIHGE